jgi:tRNA A37 threonylcarbamoyladenosine synthetase subunit TsaC/SUA5/YrdC
VIDEAVAAIRAGQPVVLPTDTVYGLCVDPNREAPARAVARL